MNSMKTLSTAELLEKTQSLVQEERRITVELIDYLREIERRFLFAELGYGSLFEFAVKHLGLSEGAAHRRICAMRLARELPEIQDRLRTGDLSLSNAAKLHRIFREQRKIRTDQAPLGTKEKREILDQVTGLSQKECDAKLLKLLPSAMQSLEREKKRVLSPDHVELKLILDAGFMEKLERLKALLSHRLSPGSGYLELFELLAGQELKRQEKKKGLTQIPDQPSSESSAGKEEIQTIRTGIRQVRTKRRAIRASVCRELWKRAGGQCEFPGCTSRLFLQIDHKKPRALGGDDSLSNLRLLCRAHNLQQAREILGEKIMEKYVPTMT